MYYCHGCDHIFDHHDAPPMEFDGLLYCPECAAEIKEGQS